MTRQVTRRAENVFVMVLSFAESHFVRRSVFATPRTRAHHFNERLRASNGNTSQLRNQWEKEKEIHYAPPTESVFRDEPIEIVLSTTADVVNHSTPSID